MLRWLQNRFFPARQLTSRKPGPRCARLFAEQLEDRVVLNTQWGVNGPPLTINTSQVSATGVSVLAGSLATGNASITNNNEVDYFSFAAPSSGFYTVRVTGNFDAMIGVYSASPSGKLLGYADNTYSGTESLKVYLDAGQTYFMGITNYRTSRPTGNYSWQIDATALGNPTVSDGARVLYVNFDGAFLSAADLRVWDDSWQYGSAAQFDPSNNGVTISAFLASPAHVDDRELIINTTLTYLEQDLAPFGISVVRLAGGTSAIAGAGATTIFVGPSTLQDRAANHPRRTLFHVASDIDVGNNNPTDIAFVYDEDWGSVSSTSLAIADVILHEAGHTFGMFHVNSGSSLETMGLRYSNSDQSLWVQDTSFMNQSFYLREFYGSQNSYQEAALSFGVTSDPLFTGFDDHDDEHRAQERVRIKLGVPMEEFSEAVISGIVVQQDAMVVPGRDLQAPPLLTLLAATQANPATSPAPALLGATAEGSIQFLASTGSLGCAIDEQTAALDSLFQTAPISPTGGDVLLAAPAAEHRGAHQIGGSATPAWALPEDVDRGPTSLDLREASNPAAPALPGLTGDNNEASMLAILALVCMAPVHQPNAPTPDKEHHRRRREAKYNQDG